MKNERTRKPSAPAPRRARSIRMDRRQVQLVEKWARERGVRFSDVIRDLIAKHEANTNGAANVTQARAA